MRILTKIGRSNPAPPPVRVRREGRAAGADDQVFSDSFSIGRDELCEVVVDSSLASRRHVEVRFEEGSWWIRDLESTNGTYVDGERISRLRIEGETLLQLGKDGPLLHLEADPEPNERRSDDRSRVTMPWTARSPDTTPHSDPSSDRRAKKDSPPDSRAKKDARPRPESTSSPDSARRGTSGGHDPSRRRMPDGDAASGEKDSAVRYTEHTIGQPDDDAEPRPAGAPLERYIDHYFADDGRPAGDHTILIRRAYAEVQKKERRKYTWVIAGVLLVAVGIASFAGYQHFEMQRQEAAAAELFMEVKEQTLATARFQALVEETGNGDLEDQLEDLEERRQRMAARYAGYVKELGVYRRLSEEEKAIYDVARIFNESEFQMPAGFVRAVRSMINDYWLGVGKQRFIQAVNRAEERGYTPVIVETMQRYGLPPEFFYLALQESNFDLQVSGPTTRWGIAKGMWQFIPSTGRRFGLSIGPREDMRVYDPQDDRHDLEQSTEAAARYLLDIYSTLAQASGLLVIASYNWGEHRVINKLESLPGPQSIPVEAFEGIPEDPRERNYWRFLGQYRDRMPEETKDYVLKIFAAAAIGQNPRLFGIDLDNPLKHYMEADPNVAVATNDQSRP